MIDCHVLSLFCRFLIFCFSTEQKLFPPQAAKTFKIFNQVTLSSRAFLKHASSLVPSCTFRNLPSASFHFIFVLKILIASECLRADTHMAALSRYVVLGGLVNPSPRCCPSSSDVTTVSVLHCYTTRT